MKWFVKTLVIFSILCSALAVGVSLQAGEESVVAQPVAGEVAGDIFNKTGTWEQIDYELPGRFYPQPVPYAAEDAAAGDRLGSPVAIDGDTALVAAHNATIDNKEGQGAAYVFTRGEDGIWRQAQKLVADDGAAFDYFGVGGDLAGDTIFIGAVGTDNEQGAVYVFTGNGGSWMQAQKLFDDEGGPGDGFGLAIAINGDTALVSASQRNKGPGAVYVYVRDAGVWSLQQKLTASDKMDQDLFGRSVAIDGDTALIGAYNVDIGGKADHGAAYVFTRSGSTWTEQAKLIASDGQAGGRIGWVVALQGDTAFLGAPAVGAENGGPGVVYVFTRSGTMWTEQQKLANGSGISGDRFGNAAALDGEWAIIGANGENDDAGAAYIYRRGVDGNWSQQQRIAAPDSMPDDAFGLAADLSDGRAIIGAFNAEVDGKENAGKFYLSASWIVTHRLTLPLVMAK